jgi:hypothetical protein
VSPVAAPTAAAPMTPPTGPDSTMWIGCPSPIAKVAVPPFDFITSSGEAMPYARSSLTRSRRQFEAVGCT